MDYRTQLKNLNLSITSLRLAIMDAFSTKSHLEASQVLNFVKDKIQTASLQAVYKNLNTLVEHNLLREIKPKDSPSIYETRTGDNHHHLVCRVCGLIEDTDCIDSAPCLTAIDNKSFHIDEAEIIFWGKCPNCQTNYKKEKL